MNKARIPFSKQMKLLEKELDAFNSYLVELEKKLYQEPTFEQATEIEKEKLQVGLAVVSIAAYHSKIAQWIPTEGAIVSADDTGNGAEDARMGAASLIAGSEKEDRFGIKAKNGAINPFAGNLDNKPVAKSMRDEGLRIVAMRTSSGVLAWVTENGQKKHARPMNPQGILESGLESVSTAYGDGTPEMLIPAGGSETILVESVAGVTKKSYRDTGKKLANTPQTIIDGIALQLIGKTSVPLATDDDWGLACSEVPVNDELATPLIESDYITNDVVGSTAQRICADIEDAINVCSDGCNAMTAPLRLYEIVDDNNLPRDNYWGSPAFTQTFMDPKAFPEIIYDLAGQQVVENPLTAGYADARGAWLNPTDKALQQQEVRRVEEELEEEAGE